MEHNKQGRQDTKPEYCCNPLIWRSIWTWLWERCPCLPELCCSVGIVGPLCWCCKSDTLLLECNAPCIESRLCFACFSKRILPMLFHVHKSRNPRRSSMASVKSVIWFLLTQVITAMLCRGRQRTNLIILRSFTEFYQRMKVVQLCTEYVFFINMEQQGQIL